MLKIVFLIIAHHMPLHLGRLIDALSHEKHCFYVHIDLKTEMEQFIHLQAPNVVFVDRRIKVEWGDFSPVSASLSLIEAASYGDFDRFVLLSGADYPIASPNEIYDFFSINREQEFFNIAEMPSPETDKNLDRLETFVPHGLLQQIRRKLFPRRDWRQRLCELQPYAGSQWWAITPRAVANIQRFLVDRSDVVDFFRNTKIPDEMFFHTIIGNMTRPSCLSPNLHFTDWSLGGSHPATITEAHFERLVANSIRAKCTQRDDKLPVKLFARKFTQGSRILDALDLWIAGPSSNATL